MRSTFILQAKKAARYIPQEPVPIKAVIPLKLKATVSGKGSNTSEVACLYEMSVLFACFKANEFDQSLCSKEIESFQKCYNTSMSRKSSVKEKETKGILVPGEKSLSHKQLNRLLGRYPAV